MFPFWFQVPATPSPRQSPEKPKTPVAEPPQKSPGVAAQSAANISSLEDTKLAIQTLQTEYDTYKKEKSENARYAWHCTHILYFDQY